MFFKDNTSSPVSSVSLARLFQSEILKFSKEDITMRNTTTWPLYSTRSRSANITLAGLETSVDPWATKPNCETIMKAIMDERNGA
jgi:hypothetical protein